MSVVPKSPPTAPILISKITISEEDVVVTLSHRGYVKYQPLTDYEAQRRGGKVNLPRVLLKDFIDRLLVVTPAEHHHSASQPGPSVLDEGLSSCRKPAVWRARSSDRQLLPLGSQRTAIAAILATIEYEKASTSLWRPPAVP